jgi:multidrug efflux pump subunit AcrA (membrane-fusion protein)
MDENLPATPGSHREDSFDIAVRGYHRGQVQEYMARSSQLLATLEQHLAVARADVQRAKAEADEARAEAERLRTEQVEAKPVHQEVSGRLSQILKLAAEEADQERATADAEIAKLRAESQAAAEQAIAQARAEAETVLTTARKTADEELTQARSTAESDLKRARDEADRLRLASVRQTQNLLDEARRRASAVNEVSNHRLETLTATHGEAVLRLGQIRDVLADLLDRDTAAGSLAEVVESVLAPAHDIPEVEDVVLVDDEDLPVAGTPGQDEVVVEDKTPALTPAAAVHLDDDPEDPVTSSPATALDGGAPEPVPSAPTPARSLDVDASIALRDHRLRNAPGEQPLPRR